ncbi:MAG TPA: GntR family transcriptional regulator [Anaerolineae bacterium]|nr:GntR family transcriptional regulator [Anaerolineae bacterium]HOQ99911.1 GntR family transcriptional regulator [Anaerolineae bacterium]HPL29309.1 GntR family transcriptional regulator [Anaerolineae bacterium]
MLPEAEETSRTRIHRELRRSIIMGHRQPNERLDIQELARCFGSSVTPVRDALQMLAQEGLVTIKPRSGCFVTHVTLRELRDIFELRAILEAAAAERAATRITVEQLAQLRHVHAGYTGDDDESYDRYTDENRRFHYLVAEATGNHELAEALGRLHDRVARFMVLRHGGESQIVTHAHIVEALAAHDAQAARQAMIDEVNASRDVIMERVMQQESGSWQIAAWK